MLERVYALNSLLPASVLLPPGDDMAMVSCRDACADSRAASNEILIAADSAIEGRHTPMGCDPYLIGRKAVLRNLSDVAAMGNARPIAIVACATLPAGIDSHRAWRLFEGLRETAQQWNAPLVGGDTAMLSSSVMHAPIIASVTILAVKQVLSDAVITRAGACVDDGVYVTGTIGGAWDAITGLGRHLDFTPRIEVAHALCAMLNTRLHAMIDVSDGLGQDLGHIARASHCDLEIDLARVPVSAGVSPHEALAQGEDYELAFTASGDVPSSIAGVAVTRIGSVVAGNGRVMVRDGDSCFDGARMGFEHATANNDDHRARGKP